MDEYDVEQLDKDDSAIDEVDDEVKGRVTKNALFAKKQSKVAKYALTQGGKKYKKYLISKKFREDEQNAGKRLSQEEKNALT